MKLNWFNIIKDLIPKEKIFEALGWRWRYGREEYTLKNMANNAGWSKEQIDVTLQTLNFMVSTGNQLGVKWIIHERGHPDWTEISAKVTVGDIVVETPRIRIRTVGLLDDDDECGTTMITKQGKTIYVCIQPNNAHGTPRGDWVVSMLLAYSASKQVGVFEAIPFVEWVFSIAHGIPSEWARLVSVMEYNNATQITTENADEIEYTYDNWNDETGDIDD